MRCNILENNACAISVHLHVNMFCDRHGDYYEVIAFDVDPDIKCRMNKSVFPVMCLFDTRVENVR